MRSLGGAASKETKGRAYLFTIARNICIDYSRAKKPDEAPLTAEVEDAVSVPEHDGFAEAIEGLPQDLQEILSLRYSQELQVNEIALIIGCSRFAVHRKIKRALSLVEESWEGMRP